MNYFLKVYKEEHEKLSNLFNVSVDKLPEKLLELAKYDRKENCHLVNLLRSVMWGLLFQFHGVLCQKKILLSILKNGDVLKEGVTKIVDTLELTVNSNKQQQIKGIFRFRKVVIFVLAFNRFVKFKDNKHCTVLHHKPSYGHNGLIFFTSHLQTAGGEFG